MSLSGSINPPDVNVMLDAKCRHCQQHPSDHWLIEIDGGYRLCPIPANAYRFVAYNEWTDRDGDTPEDLWDVEDAEQYSE